MLTSTLKQLVVGLGGHFGLTDNLDLVGRVGYADLTLDIDGLGIESPDENGYMVGGGLRGRIGEHVEIEGGAVYYDYDDVFDDDGRRGARSLPLQRSLGGRFRVPGRW